MIRLPTFLLAALLLGTGCPSAPPPVAPVVAQPQSMPSDDALTRVAVIHGGTGPWAVAGYRMGQHALKELGLTRGSLDLMVIHHAPGMVQYTCVADGAAAATGASAGKMNLQVETATVEQLRTTYLNRVTGKSVTLRPTAAFAARFLNVPYEKLNGVGATVMALPDADVFESVP